MIEDIEPRRRQFWLLGHPGWPDGLPLNPSTVEHAAQVYAEYVLPGIENQARGWTARMGVRWEPIGVMPTWTPELERHTPTACQCPLHRTDDLPVTCRCDCDHEVEDGTA